MSSEVQIDIEKVLNFIRDNSITYAQAKATRVYMEEFRKTLKAELMIEATTKMQPCSVADRESYAYNHPRYREHLKGIQVAVEQEEELRWLLVGAQAKYEVWRSMEASNRNLDRRL